MCRMQEPSCDRSCHNWRLGNGGATVLFQRLIQLMHFSGNEQNEEW